MISWEAIKLFSRFQTCFRISREHETIADFCVEKQSIEPIPTSIWWISDFEMTLNFPIKFVSTLQAYRRESNNEVSYCFGFRHVDFRSKQTWVITLSFFEQSLTSHVPMKLTDEIFVQCLSSKSINYRISKCPRRKSRLHGN